MQFTLLVLALFAIIMAATNATRLSTTEYDQGKTLKMFVCKDLKDICLVIYGSPRLCDQKF